MRACRRCDDPAERRGMCLDHWEEWMSTRLAGKDPYGPPVIHTPVEKLAAPKPVAAPKPPKAPPAPKAAKPKPKPPRARTAKPKPPAEAEAGPDDTCIAEPPRAAGAAELRGAQPPAPPSDCDKPAKIIGRKVTPTADAAIARRTKLAPVPVYPGLQIAVANPWAGLRRCPDCGDSAWYMPFDPADPDTRWLCTCPGCPTCVALGRRVHLGVPA